MQVDGPNPPHPLEAKDVHSTQKRPEKVHMTNMSTHHDSNPRSSLIEYTLQEEVASFCLVYDENLKPT